MPDIEYWLKEQGCQQDQDDLHCWRVQRPDWKAELWLDVDQLTVRYRQVEDDAKEVQRSFKYSLSRQDIEDAIFSGP